MADFTDADLKGSRFWRVDLSGSRLHGVMFQNVKITDAWVNNVDLSGLVGRLVVNEVDVTAFVQQELDKRHPERMLAAPDADGLRAAWAMIEERAQATLERAQSLPPSRRSSTSAPRGWRASPTSCVTPRRPTSAAPSPPRTVG